MIQVTGTLKDPMGFPLQGAIIRVTCKESLIVLTGSEVEINIGATAVYDFSLGEGIYLVELNQNKTDKEEYTEGTYIEVTGATTTPIELPALINQYPWVPIT